MDWHESGIAMNNSGLNSSQEKSVNKCEPFGEKGKIGENFKAKAVTV